MGMLAGKTAVITGAGRGTGRQIALAMAESGARILVNDSGSSPSGLGSDPALAVQVVQEIKAKGGEAAASTDAPADWQGAEKIMASARDHFGGIDILVNNAEIRRDSPCFDISGEEWQSVLQAHLKGAFLCTRLAGKEMRKQKQGRMIHLISASGLIGDKGCINYGTAKMAIAGLSRNVAIEMKQFNFTSNCIAPVPSERENLPVAADVAPLAVFLAAEASKNISGQIFGVRGSEISLFSQPRITRSIHHSQGWPVDRLVKILTPSMKAYFTPVETSESYFSWDPMD